MATQPIIDITSQRFPRVLGGTIDTNTGKPTEGGVSLDAVIEESIQLSSTVTSFPIERGADINDHVIAQAKRYRLHGIVTDTPTEYAHVQYPHGQAATRSLSAWAMLEALWEAGEPFDVFTGWRTYKGLVIERITSRKNASRDRVVEFDADLVELRLVAVAQSRTALPAERLAAEARAGMAEKVDLGYQPGRELNRDDPSDDNLWLKGAKVIGKALGAGD